MRRWLNIRSRVGVSSRGRPWVIACCAPSSAARTTAGDRARASASRRRSRRYIPPRDAACVATSRPRSLACRSTMRVTLRLDTRANPVARTRATAPVRRKLCRNCWVRLAMSRVGSEGTQGYPAGQACLISCTYDSGAQLRPGGRRGAVAGAMGARAHQRARLGPATPAVLQPHDVPLSLRGGTTRGEHVRVHRRRYLRPVQAAPGLRCIRADRIRRIRHSFRELRAFGRHASGEAHSPEHRDVPPPAEALRRHVRLASRALYHRSEEHTSELQSQSNLVCRLLLEKKKKTAPLDEPTETDAPHALQ